MKPLFFAGLLTVTICIPTFAQTLCTIAPDTFHLADFCQKSTAPTWQAAASTNHELIWYKQSTDTVGSTTKPTISNAIAGIQSVWVAQRLLNDTTCKSERLELSVKVVTLPFPPVVTNASYCQNGLASPLTATGSNLKWYTTSTGGASTTTAPLPNTSTYGYFSFYVTSSTNGSPSCESPRSQIDITIIKTPAAPIVSSPIVYCQNATATTLSATGTNLRWYNAATGGAASSTAPTLSTTYIGSVNYYVSQRTIGLPSCEGPRSQITVNVVANPSAPTVTNSSDFCEGTVAPVWTATASNASFELGWYGASNGGAGIYGKPPVIASKPAGIRNVWVSQRTIAAPKCESKRIPLSVNVLPLSDSRCINAQPDTANEFRGYVFADLNNNKIKDVNESYLANMKVTVEPIGYATFTDANGYYSIRINQLGRFTLSAQSAGYYTYAIKTDSIESYFQTIDTDLGIKPVNFNDFKISIIGLNLPEPGSKMNFILQIKNRGTETTNVNLKFITPYEYILQNASGMDSIISTNEWKINNISPGSTKTVNVFGKVSSDTYYNSVLSFKAIVVADGTDISFSSTEDEEILHWIYVSSPTSNYLVVKEAPATISQLQVANGEPLDYTIRFQNTGMDTIFSVTVADTLSESLQPSSFEVVSTSHPCKTIVKGRYVHFEFQNIRLPDSSTNEPASHGYVRFQVKPQNTLMLGDSIPNKAFVYFDNNNLMTNTVVTTVKEPIVTSYFESETVNDAFKIYPNPSKDYLNIISNQTGNLEITDISGQLLHKEVIYSQSQEIDILEFKAGTYLYRFTTNYGVKFGKVIKQ